MKEIFEALESRIKSPVMGYFLLSFVAFNWQPLFYLIVENKGALERIDFFVGNTTWKSMFLYPFIASSFVAVIYPWINYAFLYLCLKPTELKNTLQAQSEHSLLLKKNELESLRTELEGTVESNIISRAQRDQEIESIDNEEIKEQVKSEIDKVRSSNDSFVSINKAEPDYENSKKLMEMAAMYRDRAANTTQHEDTVNLKEKARELESKAHDLLMDGNNA